MKIAIITGADGGMGVEITKAVARAGYYVVMACRNRKKAELRRAEILAAYREGLLEVAHLDLASFRSVSAFSAFIAKKFRRVDLLMNNAGMISQSFGQTPDGFEQTVSVNYLAPYLLTRLLIPLMPKGARIVNMTSFTIRAGRIALPDFFYRGRKGSFRAIGIYANTKVAVELFTAELSRRLQPKGITVNAADPGFVSTKILRFNKWYDTLTDIFLRPFLKNPRQGAQTAIRLLLEKEYAATTGKVLTHKKLKDIPSEHKYKSLQTQLWKDTERVIKG